jgi:hypothetical protein
MNAGEMIWRERQSRITLEDAEDELARVVKAMPSPRTAGHYVAPAPIVDEPGPYGFTFLL